MTINVHIKRTSHGGKEGRTQVFERDLGKKRLWKGTTITLVPVPIDEPYLPLKVPFPAVSLRGADETLSAATCVGQTGKPQTPSLFPLRQGRFPYLASFLLHPSPVPSYLGSPTSVSNTQHPHLCHSRLDFKRWLVTAFIYVLQFPERVPWRLAHSLCSPPPPLPSLPEISLFSM